MAGWQEIVSIRERSTAGLRCAAARRLGLVKAFLNLMVENDEALNMKRVVAAAGMSARTFQRQLKEEGASFSDLLADVRQSETLKRLKERNLTIAAIATDLGYSDQAAFTRAFRRWTGVSPSVPRDAWLKSR